MRDRYLDEVEHLQVGFIVWSLHEVYLRTDEYQRCHGYTDGILNRILNKIYIVIVQNEGKLLSGL